MRTPTFQSRGERIEELELYVADLESALASCRKERDDARDAVRMLQAELARARPYARCTTCGGDACR